MQIDELMAQLQAVKVKFPDASLHLENNKIHFRDKVVNQQYTDLEFITNFGVYVLPYCNIETVYNGNTNSVKVYSIPKRNKLVYTEILWDHINNTRIQEIRFAKLSANLKNRLFNTDDMINLCHQKIIDYIK